VTRTKSNALVEMPYRAGQRHGLQRDSPTHRMMLSTSSLTDAPDSEMASALVDGEGEQKKNTWVGTTCPSYYRQVVSRGQHVTILR
jgi:alpha-acetolactate decarboxylase